MTFGMLYWLAPRLFQTVASPASSWPRCTSGSAHWAFLFYIVAIYAAGVTQGPLMWRAFDETGRLAYRTSSRR